MAWFVDAFGPWYRIVYPHRDAAEAEALIRTVGRHVSWAGARVLDVGCGPGRHLEQVAAAGARPVGLDLSPDLLSEAAQVRSSSGGDWPLLRGDMRFLPLADASCDGVTSLFTSFGYFDSAGDRSVLAEAARVLRPGGFHVLDFLNRERVLAHPNPETVRRSGDWEIRETRRIEDGRCVVKRVQVSAVTGGDIQTDYEERVMLYSKSELVDWLAQAGLSVQQIWGEYDGRPFDEESSSRLVLLSQRESE